MITYVFLPDSHIRLKALQTKKCRLQYCYLVGFSKRLSDMNTEGINIYS